MRQVILQIDISLDGFAAGSQGETDWVTADEVMNRDANALLRTVDTILLGRVAYQAFAAYWPFADTTASSTQSQIARQLNEATKVVFSKTLDTVAWGRWNNARLAKGAVRDEILAMKAQPGKDLLLYAGAEIVSTCIQLGLVDQYRLRVHPVVLGNGKSIFTNRNDRRKLKLLQATSYQNGAVVLDYQPSTI